MYRIHVYGNPSVPTSTNLTSDAFTQTAYKYGKALKEMGHYIIMYGTKEFASEFICDEFISINCLQDFINPTETKMEISAIIEEYSRGAYLSNMLNECDENKKREIVDKSRNNLLEYLNKNTIHENDIFLTFWDICGKNIFEKIEALGGIVIEGLAQYGTQEWTYRFNRTIFASFAEARQRHKVQKLIGKHHIIIPPFFEFENFTYSKVKENAYLYLGRIQEHKGFGIIIQLAKHFPNKIFWVAGQARTEIKDNCNYLEYQKYNQEMAWLDLTTVPNLIYKGLADKSLRKDLLSRASILIQPSMYDEPFGWNVIEANLSGTPVITSDRGAFLETIKEGLNGYRINPLSSYKTWENIFAKAEKLSSEECYNYAIKNYNKEYIMSSYIQYIANILTDKGELFNQEN